MKNAARKREQSQVYLSYAEREQYRCEASMKNEESMRSIIATPGFQERSDKDFLKDFLGFLAKGNNTYPAAVENSSF